MHTFKKTSKISNVFNAGLSGLSHEITDQETQAASPT